MAKLFRQEKDRSRDPDRERELARREARRKQAEQDVSIIRRPSAQR